MIDRAGPFIASQNTDYTSNLGALGSKVSSRFAGPPLSLRSTFVGDGSSAELDLPKASGDAGPQPLSKQLLAKRSLLAASIDSTSSPGTLSAASSSATSLLRSESATPSLSPMASTPLTEQSQSIRKRSSSSLSASHDAAPPESDPKMKERHWSPLETSYGASVLDRDEETLHDEVHSNKTMSPTRPLPPTLPLLSRQSRGERLPGIASLDEHMSTSWKAGLAARRREEETGPRSPFSPSTTVFGDRASFNAQEQERLAQRRGTATEPMSPRMSSLKREIAPFEDEHQAVVANARTLSPSSRGDENGKRAERYPVSPSFAHPSSSRRATLRDDEEYSSRWGREERESFPALRHFPGDSYRSSPLFNNSLRTRSLGNWKVGGVDESTFRRDSYRMGVPAVVARGSAPSSTTTSYDAQHRPSASSSTYDSRMYDMGDERSSFYDDASQPGSRQPSYVPSGGVSPSGAAGVDSHGGNSPGASRRRGKLPKPVTDLLKTWLLEHASHPYPTEDEKKRLCDATGLTISQVSNWFINARRRILVPTGSGGFGVGGPGPHAGSMPMVGAHGEARYGPPPPQYAGAPGSHYAPPYYSQDMAAHEAEVSYRTGQRPSWHDQPMSHGAPGASAPRYGSGDPRYAPAPPPSGLSQPYGYEQRQAQHRYSNESS